MGLHCKWPVWLWSDAKRPQEIYLRGLNENIAKLRAIWVSLQEHAHRFGRATLTVAIEHPTDASMFNYPVGKFKVKAPKTIAEMEQYFGLKAIWYTGLTFKTESGVSEHIEFNSSGALVIIRPDRIPELIAALDVESLLKGFGTGIELGDQRLGMPVYLNGAE